MADVAPLDPEKLVTTLAKHGVRYVLIGALAARMQGFPRVTADADVTPANDPANLKQLATALRELNARVYTEAVPEGLAFDCSAAMLSRAAMWNLVTAAGRVDVSFQPAGTDGYDDLARGAVQYDVFGTVLQVARLEDIVRSKEAANRPKDRQDVLILKEMIRNQRRNA